MNIKHNIKTALASVLLLGLFASCSDDFLLEENNRTFDTDRFTTVDGIEEMTTGIYTKLKFQFNYSWGVRFYDMGTDEYTDANNESPAFNGYGQELRALSNWDQTQHWDNHYAAIESANSLIQNIPLYYDQDNENYNTRLGEAYFFRAYFYFELVQQYGGVPLKLQPSTSVETYFPRASAEDCYTQIISDFEEAYKHLPDAAAVTQVGRVHKTAAAHYLAKAHLTRASEINESWNSSYKASDLDAVIKYADEVIKAHPLANNYSDLYNFNKANDDNEVLSEIILAAQFSNDWTTLGRFGNQMHLYYPSVYMDLAGCKRDISGGREFCFTRTTDYMTDVFDRVNDSRFWKSFITTYGCNYTDGAPVYTEANAPDPSLVGTRRFEGGQLGMKYIVNNPTDTRYTPAVTTGEEGDEISDPTGVYKDGVFVNTHTFVRYFNGESKTWTGQHGNYGYYSAATKKRYLSTSKHRDGFRQSLASQFGVRDGILARSAEDVLMAAEAYIRKGEPSNAIPYFNQLRERAAYKSGEDRTVHKDGGQSYLNNPYCEGKGGGYSADGAIFWPSNTYYESNNDMAVTTESSENELLLSGIEDIENSTIDRTINEMINSKGGNESIYMTFLLDERTRELSSEQLRWKDLARTMTIGPRIRAFNDGQVRAKTPFSDQTICLRPIPQHFLDAITNENGSALSADEKQAMQNPGY
nr:RagB/SusD family nutrient uptake outer membrane protein [uncultured Carboxylicivirga sp.]